MTKQQLPWDLPDVFSIAVTVSVGDCDRYGHTNNVVYLKWLEQVAWAHAEHVELGFAAYERLGVGVVARRHELDYLLPSFADDELAVGTWVTENNGRVEMWRAFQIIRVGDGRTIMRAKTRWACVDMKTGRPRRQPPEFVKVYQPVQHK